MTRATPELRGLARRLLAREAGDGRDPEEVVAAAERVCRQLGEPLSKLVGRAGFHSLLARAVNLAAAEFPLLQGIEGEKLNEDSLQGLRVALPGQDPAEVMEAMVSIVANVVWLLVTFIGRKLTLGVVSRIWPDVPTGDAEPGSSEVGR